MQQNKPPLHTGLLQLQTNDDLDVMLWIDFREDPAQSAYPLHGHAWGEFIYAFNGVMDIHIANQHYITPPPYGIWLPPNLEHSSVNRTAVSHATLYIHESLCDGLAENVGILLTSPLVSAILIHLKQHPFIAQSAEHQRLLHVLLDQLKQAPLIQSYLPHSEHPKLKAILDFLYQHPEDQSPLSYLAMQHNMTERTLARYSQKELGMTLHEWRQRLKIMQAMTLLKQNKSIEHIAFDLGYANASAFIHMFKRWMGNTPDQFRKHFQHSRH
jgi:AraC-like DNA-binding protein